jgi:hypothetical protein
MTPLSYLAKTMPYRTIFARFWPCFERSLKQQLKIQDAQLFKKIKFFLVLISEFQFSLDNIFGL